MRDESASETDGANHHGTGRSGVEILIDFDIGSGYLVVRYYVGVHFTHTYLEEIVWRCTVCGGQGRGSFDADAASAYRFGRAILGTACCGEPSLVCASWGVCGQYQAGVWYASGVIRGEVRNEVHARLEKGADLLTWLDSLKKTRL